MNYSIEARDGDNRSTWSIILQYSQTTTVSLLQRRKHSYTASLLQETYTHIRFLMNSLLNNNSLRETGQIDNEALKPSDQVLKLTHIYTLKFGFNFRKGYLKMKLEPLRQEKSTQIRLHEVTLFQAYRLSNTAGDQRYERGRIVLRTYHNFSY